MPGLTSQRCTAGWSLKGNSGCSEWERGEIRGGMVRKVVASVM